MSKNILVSGKMKRFDFAHIKQLFALKIFGKTHHLANPSRALPRIDLLKLCNFSAGIMCTLNNMISRMATGKLKSHKKCCVVEGKNNTPPYTLSQSKDNH